VDHIGDVVELDNGSNGRCAVATFPPDVHEVPNVPA
jgi:hypothetical protein